MQAFKSDVFTNILVYIGRVSQLIRGGHADATLTSNTLPAGVGAMTMEDPKGPYKVSLQ